MSTIFPPHFVNTDQTLATIRIKYQVVKAFLMKHGQHGYMAHVIVIM